jgi:hypothetical protein
VTKLISVSAHEISKIRELAKRGYSDLWRRVTREWSETRAGNTAWLTYSANYLLHTAGVRWAIDPFSMSSRVPGLPAPNFADDLGGLELVALTHDHADHLDLNLISGIAHLPIQWVVPEYLIDKIISKASIPESQITIPKNGEEIRFKDLSLTPFDSLHIHGKHGVKETGYLVEFDGQSWLFPGDIRNYNADLMPGFGPLHGIFVHLWLGKASACIQPPPLSEDFCNFYIKMKPERLVVTHLYELGRDENDLWGSTHFEFVKNQINTLSPTIQVSKAVTGDQVRLT